MISLNLDLDLCLELDWDNIQVYAQSGQKCLDRIKLIGFLNFLFFGPYFLFFPLLSCGLLSALISLLSVSFLVILRSKSSFHLAYIFFFSISVDFGVCLDSHSAGEYRSRRSASAHLFCKANL